MEDTRQDHGMMSSTSVPIVVLKTTFDHENRYAARRVVTVSCTRSARAKWFNSKHDDIDCILLALGFEQ